MSNKKYSAKEPRDRGGAFQDGSSTFQDYMRRKIVKQRQQFGMDGDVAASYIGSKAYSAGISNIFQGVVVLVNGHTDPDADTIMRLLHDNGGDLEKYETTRVTHVIAERLSDAKANVYRRQRKRPTPVCKPGWLLDSIKAGKLLPCGPYIVDQLVPSVNSVKTMFARASKNKDESFTTSSENQCEVDNTSHEVKHNNIESSEPSGQVKSHKISGKTVGNDPNFLESYFNSSRLSFIGSYKRRSQSSSNMPSRAHCRKSKGQRRSVFHIDMDCFFASVVLRNYPQYLNKPVAIGHATDLSMKSNISTSELSTCNYEARKFGVQKGMWLHQAQQICPDLIVLPYDFKAYEEVSNQVADIVYRYSEHYQGCVEETSCDEFYLEFYADKNVDLLNIAEAIRSNIDRETCGCTASIGVGKNKLLAKVSSDLAKPNRSRLCQDWKQVLRGLHLSEIPGVGRVSQRKLAKKQLFKVEDVWSLEDDGELELKSILGQVNGKKLFQFCQGNDDRPVAPVPRKTIGAECNYGVRFNGPYGVDHMMTGLANEVERRMKSIQVNGKRMTLKVMQRKENAKEPSKFNGHGACNNFSKAADLPGRPTRSHKLLASIGMKLFHEMNVELEDVRGMGIVVSLLEFEENSSKENISVWFESTSSNKGVSSVKRNSTSSVRISEQFVSSADQLNTEQVAQEKLNSPSATGETVNSEMEVISLIDNEDNGLPRQSTCNNEYGASFDFEQDGDILLPSQINKDVLDELPSDLKEEILYSIDKKRLLKKDKDDNCNESKSMLKKEERLRTNYMVSSAKNLALSKNEMASSRKGFNRQKQLNMKEMMGLHVAKSNHQVLRDVAGDDVSLTQFNQLPINVQLEVVNGLPNKTHRNMFSEGGKQTLESRCSKRLRNDDYRKNAVNNTDFVQKAMEAQQDEVQMMSNAAKQIVINKETVERSFYEDNVKPLHQFMNNHSNPSSDNVQHVLKFFNICFSEGREEEIVYLLRSIKRRKDKWKYHYCAILDVCKDCFSSTYKRDFDLSWHGL